VSGTVWSNCTDVQLQNYSLTHVCHHWQTDDKTLVKSSPWSVDSRCPRRS